MSGFKDVRKLNLNFQINKDEINKILKKYKKIKKYQRSPLFEVKTMDGTETYVSKLIQEAQENL
jgi:hypothetical protein